MTEQIIMYFKLLLGLLLASCSEAQASYNAYLYSDTYVPTITLVGGAGNVVPVFTTNSATYTCHGRTCFFNYYFVGDGGAEGAGTGQVTLSLPISTSAAQLPIKIPIGSGLNSTNDHVLFAEFMPSATTFKVFKDNVVGVELEPVAMTGADLNNANRTLMLMGKWLR